MKINATMIVLPINDLSKTISYYQDNYNFQVSVLWPEDNPNYILISNGHNHLGFIKSDKQNTDNKEISINFDVDNIDDVYAKIKENVNIIEKLSNAEYNRKEFSLLDCNGYKITIGQYVNNENSEAS